ncbi:hypothetical protein RB653_007215 [Dictyostelium firmibasis]|uniref:Uncharacterized protein n=1 Tax=Dictyostelium firmibasis TaxID=79012 RepID=A0AAN7TLE6_9MYCE
MNKTQSPNSLDVAVIGVGFRFPGNSNDPESLWNNLLDGFDAITQVPKERWATSFREMGLIKNKFGGFLKDSEWKNFDPLFFGIGAKEAPFIDPQQRLLLSIVWESLEDAHIRPDELRGSNTGVFIGVSNNDYTKLGFQDNYSISPYTMTGTNSSLNSNRISYCFDFRGPSLTVDTACSSSLVSVNLGVQSIQMGECNIAICGGVNALFDPSTSVAFSKLGVLSENGRCNSFSDQASGYVRSEGAGVVVLKSLEQAKLDGDRIYGVIKGVSSNEDGASNGDKNSLTTPSCEAQANNISKAMEKASLSPSDIYYIEAHGTGTPVGDPIEVKALSKIFSTDYSDNDYSSSDDNNTSSEPLFIGSFKSNIGHLESAAGIASLIKCCLMLKNRMLVPSINCSNLNPSIPFDQYNISVIREIKQFPTDKLINIGINSFGFGGSNCHLIIQEYKNNFNNNYLTVCNNKIDYLIPISSKTKKSLDKYLNLIKMNSNYHRDILFDDFVRYQIKSKQYNLSNRMTTIANDWNSFIKGSNELQNLTESDGGGNISKRSNNRDGSESANQANTITSSNSIEPLLVFVFCGQGPQWNGMIKTLYTSERVFKNTVDHVDSILFKYFGYSILNVLSSVNDDDSINHPIIAQPSLFLLQIGLVELLKHWGIYPSISVGHSFGEVSSYYLSGIISLETACKIVYVRSSNQNKTMGSGKMLVVSMSAKQWSNEFGNDWLDIEIACFNAPDSIVVTGNEQRLKELSVLLSNESNQIFNTFLRSPCSFHSSFQEVIKDSIFEQLSDLESTGETEIPLFSTVTGRQFLNGHHVTAQHIYENVREPVHFQKTIENITSFIKSNYPSNQKVIYVEIAPHPTLFSLIKKSIPSSTKNSSLVVCPLNRKENSNNSFKKLVSQLYFNGLNVDFAFQLSNASDSVDENNDYLNRLNETNSFKETTGSLPRYQWEQDEYWSEPLISKKNRLEGPTTSLLGHRLIYSFPIFQSVLDLQSDNYKYLLDHLVKGKPVFPGAGYLDIIIEFFGYQQQQINSSDNNSYIINIDKIQFLNPIHLTENKLQTLQSSFEPILSKKSTYSVNFFIKDSVEDQSKVKSIQDETWTNTCKASISFEQQQPSPSSTLTLSKKQDLQLLRNRCDISKLEKFELYDKISKNLGLQYNPLFQVVDTIETGKDCSFAILSLPEDTLFKTILNPCLLDNCFHGLLTLINEKGSFVVESISSVSIYLENISSLNQSVAKVPFYLYTTISKATSFSSEGTCKLFSKDGDLILSIGKFTIKSTNPKSTINNLTIESPLDETFSIEWQSKDSPIPTPLQIQQQSPLSSIPSFIRSTILKDNQFELYCSSIIHKQLVSHEKAKNHTFIINSLGDVNEKMQSLSISNEYIRFFTRILSIIKQYPVILSDKELKELKEIIELKYPSEIELLEFEVIEKVSNIIPKLLFENDKQASMTLFQDNLLTRFYSNSNSTRFYLERVSEIVLESIRPIIKEKRVFRILEIGAGTGSLSNVVLTKLNSFLVSLNNCYNIIIEYTFTDISANFIIGEIQETMCSLYPNVSFKFSVLDVEKEVNSSDFLLGDYDVILMAYVIHAVSNIKFSIEQLYKLLSPRGWLLCIEPKENVVFSDLVFGCFNQWWNYNDDIRTTHCSLSESQWNQLLINSTNSESGCGGFSNVSFIGGEKDVDSHSFVLHCQKESISQMKLTNSHDNLSSGSIVLILNNQQLTNLKSYPKVMEYIQEATSLCKTIEIIDSKDVLNSTNSVSVKIQKSMLVLCLLGLDLVENNYQEQSFEYVKLLNLISTISSTNNNNNNNNNNKAPKVLLITKQSERISRSFYSRSLIGISRTSMNEYPNISITSIDLDSNDYTLNSLLKPLFSNSKFSDNEFILKKGLMFVSRIFKNKQLLESSNAFETDSSNLYCKASSDLSFKYAIKQSMLAENQIEIKVECVGINFKDNLFYKGLLPQEIFRMGDIYNPPFGLECSGVITRIGSKVTEYSIGQNVFGFARHSLGSHVITNKDLVILKPDSISFSEAASIPVVYCTAWYSLFNIGQLTNEDSVLIHSATGGVGLASLNLLKMKQHLNNVFATVGSIEKKKFLIENFKKLFKEDGENIFSTRDKEYSNQLESKVDVILNTLSGDYVESNFKSLRSFGRLIDLSATHVYANQQIGLGNFKFDHLYSAVDLERLIDEKPKLLQSILQNITKEIVNGNLEKIPISIFPSVETKDAIELLSKRSHIGKVIVDCTDISKCNPVSDVIKNFSTRLAKPHYQLKLNSTLLITGQSGLSIPLLNWLLSKSGGDVKNVVIISKSTIKWRLQTMISHFVSEFGIQFNYVQVDISNYDALSEAIKQLPSDLPPIKSVFHLAAIYNDVPMDQVTMSTVESVHNPKVLGAVNLHRISVSFGWRLNHFVLFSSITGITGYPDQSIYNSANSVLDALSNFRRFMGLPSFSINLGPMKDEGKVSTNKSIKKLFKSRGLPSLPLNKLFGLLEVVINNPTNSVIPSQLICSPIDFKTYVESFSNMRPKLLHLQPTISKQSTIANVDPMKSTSISLQDKITSKVSDLLSIPISKINFDHPLKQYGLDSLLTVQFKSWIDKEFEKNLFTHIQLATITINSFVDKVNSLSNGSGNNNVKPSVKEEKEETTTQVSNDELLLVKKEHQHISISPDIRINNSTPKRESLTKTPLLNKLSPIKIAESIMVSTSTAQSDLLKTPPIKSLNNTKNSSLINTPPIQSVQQHQKQQQIIQALQQPLSRLSYKSNNNSFILGIGTSVPGEPISQQSLKDSISNDFSDKAETNEKVKRIFEQSQIKTRHLVRDYTKPENSIKFRHLETITDVNNQFKKVVPDLAQQACLRALKDWGGDKEDITHIVSVTSTGIIIPDVNFKLIDLLGLNKDVERVSLNLMGCLAGLSSLRTAASLAKASPRNRILVVCTEVCSLHFSNTDGGDQIVASSIFADGSAAYVVGCNPRIEETPLYEVMCSINRSVSNTENAMVWDLVKEGWNLGLDASIPIVIGSGIEAFVDTLLDKAKLQTSTAVSAKDCEFLIHTGGKSILMNIENSLGIDPKQTKNTWDVYHAYGNMSSASVIFVMDHARKSKSLPTYSISLAFGPGLAFEGCFLKNVV